MKTSELTGEALDWAVAKCNCPTGVDPNCNWEEAYRPSTDWSQGGPIIERHPIKVGRTHDRDGFAAYSQNGVNCVQYGPTPLLAAMRCYVASKLGDTIDIPKELL